MVGEEQDNKFVDSQTSGEDDGKVPHRSENSTIKKALVTTKNMPVEGAISIMDAENSNGDGAAYDANLRTFNAEKTVFST